MTSLAGDFQTDLSLDDALVACAEAIDGLGWRIEEVGGDRIVSYPDHGPSQQSPRIEVQRGPQWSHGSPNHRERQRCETPGER